MADLKYSIGIDTSQAQRSIDSLKNSIAGFGAAIASALAARELITITARFEDLRITLQTLYRDVSVGTKTFNDIKDFAKTSTFAVEDLVQTVIKLKTAGIEPNIALLRLFADVTGSVADKVGALQAITDLYARTTAGGLGLEDLNRLADRGIPVFTILQEKLGVTRLELSKLGQTAEGAQLILKALEAGLAETFAGGSAAKANSLTQAISNLKDTFNNLVDLMGQMGLNKALADLINAFGGVLESLKPVVAMIGMSTAGAFKILADNIKIVTAAMVAMLTVFSVSIIARLVQGVMLLTTAFGALGKTPVLRTLTFIASALAGVATALKLDIGGNVDDASKGLDDLNKKLNEFEKGGQLPAGKLAKDTGDFKAQVADLYVQTSKYRLELEQSVNAYARQNSELVKRLQFEQNLIGLTDQQKTVKQALFDLENSYLSEVAKLTDEYRKKSQSKSAEDQAQLPLIQEALKKVTAEYSSQIETIKELTNQNYLLAEAEKQRLAFSEFAIKNQLDRTKDLIKLQDDMAKMTMSEIEKKYYDIDAAARDSAMSAIEAENSRRRSLKLAAMTTEEEQRYYEEARRGTDELKQRTSELYNQSRQFSTGWKNAFQSYIDDATNAARTAERIFQKATSAMEDLIVNFAKTGKFEFKNFVNSILEELLRSQIRQAMAQIFQIGGAAGGGANGGLMSSIGNLLGFANGGVIPTNAPVLVGERGPELISGASGRVVTPNDQLGMGPTYVTYNISAVDALSFKQMVAADPSFIYAVSQQGSKGIPGRR